VLFRADHVGSQLRPAELNEASDKAARGETTPAALRQIEDRAIGDVVAQQEKAGLESITGGEFHRAIWHVDFLTGFDGIRVLSGLARLFRAEVGAGCRPAGIAVRPAGSATLGARR
jgi:5-methyltetrahydropteroyltriglutamate--homocysteine methyltransferase